MKQSLRWIPVILWAGLTWRLTTTPDFKVTEDTLLSLLISNGGHFVFFGVQATLLLFALPSKIWNLSPIIFAVVTSSLYGLVIELVQRNIPGRSGDIFDWLLDTLGAIIFLAIIKKLSDKKS